NTLYCLEEQIRRLDYENQYAVLGRRFDTSYLTGRYGVSDKSLRVKKVVAYSYPNSRANYVIRGDQSGTPNINYSSVTRAQQKYIKRGCCTFLAHITEKKSEERGLEDVPIVHDFPEVFPEDLPGLPPPRQVEFQIKLVPGASPVARAPYRLAPFEDARIIQ
ncbi:hypothetical protein Tco_0890093, partial [Tanacetum coccineum]